MSVIPFTLLSLSCIISLMPYFDFINLIVLILAAGAALGFLYLQRKSIVHEHEISVDEEKGYHLLHQATKKAQAILGMAELDAIKVASDTKFYKQKLEGKFQEELDNTSKSTQNLIKEEAQKAHLEFTTHLQTIKISMDKATEEYFNYLKYLKTEGDAARNQNQDVIRQQIAQVFVKFEENLSQYLLDTQQRSMQSIELELKAARGLIETYKEHQLKLIDENVIAMLEKTLSLVLTKKLSLQDQIDLVYEALEKAKVEKFIV